ncbi:MAG TPA: tRNA (5-methylaminomethyl-2-thiouridine)(34)-methyltransferase MnmD [Caulobacteraceae bacterium]
MTARPPSAELDWTAEGAPRSRRFDDIYFSREGGLDETRAVFLQGCGLPEAWAGRRRFTVGETGFGTGLNVLALLDLWRTARPPGGRLSVFSVEAYPMAREEAERALAAWPELADLAALLIRRWPRRAPGFHRVDLPELDAALDLAVGDAQWGIETWGGAADAWFLDGFAPARNPEMWRPGVLQAIAARSAPGARLATFTVAGSVRRGLQEAGFEVDKRPGHGAKRERLEARLPGAATAASDPPQVAVIGAGIAGAALARAFRALGVRPLVVDAGVGDAASGNPAALVSPALDAGGGARAQFYAQAFARAVDLYRELGEAAVIDGRVEQLARTERDPARFQAVLDGGLFAEGALTRTEGGLMFEEGLVVRPQAIIDAWLGGCGRLTARVERLERTAGRWRLHGADGVIAEADVVVIAAGAGSGPLMGRPAAFTPVRGQASWVPGLELDHALAWGGYACPMDGGVLFGATHDRGRADIEVAAEDHARNLKTLAEGLPGLAATAEGLALQGRAAVRATTFDRMPAVGPLGEPCLYLLGGLGSRGFCTAPLLAEHLAAEVLGAPSPLPNSLLNLNLTLRLEKIWRSPTGC